MNVTNLLKFQFHQMMHSFLEGRFLLVVVALVPIDSGRNFGRSQVLQGRGLYFSAGRSFRILGQVPSLCRTHLLPFARSILDHQLWSECQYAGMDIEVIYLP